MKNGSSFINKLYMMFSESYITKNKWNYIYGWFDDESIVILKPILFLDICCKDIFRFTKINSFYRQLNLYGFIRVSTCDKSKIYKNKLFSKNMNYTGLVNIRRFDYNKDIIIYKGLEKRKNVELKFEENKEDIQFKKIKNSKINSDYNFSIEKKDYLNLYTKFKSEFDFFDSIIEDNFKDANGDSYLSQLDRIQSFNCDSLEKLYEIELDI